MGATLSDVDPRNTGGVSPSITHPLSTEELRKIGAYWRACNYLAAGMIYLRDNPLLREALKPEHIKNRLLGHWGSSTGLSFTYVHLNRLIKKYDLNAIFLAGPGHGAPGVLGPVYLEGTYSEIYPSKSEDEEECARSSKSSPSPAVSVATALQKPRVLSMKGASWVTAFPTLSGLRLTIPTCWWRSWWVMAKQRRGH